jgi:hypothetical protein
VSTWSTVELAISSHVPPGAVAVPGVKPEKPDGKVSWSDPSGLPVVVLAELVNLNVNVVGAPATAETGLTNDAENNLIELEADTPGTRAASTSTTDTSDPTATLIWAFTYLLPLTRLL